MIVKVAPFGGRVSEVNVEMNTSVGECLQIAGESVNGRTLRLNNETATEDTPVVMENSIITLAVSQKGGSK